MKRSAKLVTYILLFIAANCIIPAAHGQGGFGDLDDGDTTDMPLDGGTTIVAAGGFAYIVRKIAERKRA